MHPVSPVISEKFKDLEIILAKNQPQYKELPVICIGDRVMHRWTFTEDERKAILDGADLYITVMNFASPLQPISLLVSNNSEKVIYDAYLKAHTKE